MPGQDFDNRELEASYWIVKNRLKAKRFFYWLLIGFIVITYSYSAWGLIRLYVLDYDNYRRLILELPLDLVNYQGIKEIDNPRDIVVNTSAVIPLSGSKYDLGVNVTNPNEKWFVEFDYRFISDGLKSQYQHAFILPSDTKYLVEYAVGGPARLDAPIFDVQNIKWNKHLNAQEFRDERFKFRTENVLFVPAGQSDISGKQAISKTTFKLVNDSVYNYWKVPVTIALYTGTKVSALNHVVLEKVMSGQSVPVEINWFQPLGVINKTEVLIDLNVFDQSIYMPFEGGSREESR